jgi:hypothetical protein
MKDWEDLLKCSVPRWQDLEPRRDLWPEMRRRIEAAAPVARFGWLDWTIAGLAAGSLVVFPRLALGLLYQV